MDDMHNIFGISSKIQRQNVDREPKGPYSSHKRSLSSRNGAFQHQACFPSAIHDSRDQPLDFRIIRNFKVKYRKMLLEFLLSHEDVTILANAIKR
jgi:hypothetical protein